MQCHAAKSEIMLTKGDDAERRQTLNQQDVFSKTQRTITFSKFVNGMALTNDMHVVNTINRIRSPINVDYNDNKKQLVPLLSCVSCRKLHRKCSKTLPKCSECEIHARECIYKRGTNNI